VGWPALLHSTCRRHGEPAATIQRDRPQSALPSLSSRSGRSLVAGPCFDPRMHRVVLGALVREGRVLLVHRSPNKRAYPNVWDLPGGVIEFGESELSALTRELHEELGVQIATGSASHLCRSPHSLALGSCVTGRERRRTPPPRNTTTSDGSSLRSCLLPSTFSCAQLCWMRYRATPHEHSARCHQHERTSALAVPIDYATARTVWALGVSQRRMLAKYTKVAKPMMLCPSSAGPRGDRPCLMPRGHQPMPGLQSPPEQERDPVERSTGPAPEPRP
jgi:8-oxo-dGTP pyrophosphatase MutT (NUDIX family)